MAAVRLGPVTIATALGMSSARSANRLSRSPTMRSSRSATLSTSGSSQEARALIGDETKTIDVAVRCPACLAVDRTDVEAGAAPDAGQHLGVAGPAQHRAPVVYDDDVQLIRAVELVPAARAMIRVGAGDRDICGAEDLAQPFSRRSHQLPHSGWTPSASAASPRVSRIAGTTMCCGRSPRICIRYSPRSVSTTSSPAFSSA
jgi:hypothetical protein